ncbi:MAG: capping complex subunit for YIEGIA [Moorellaceae bacterium]
MIKEGRGHILAVIVTRSAKEKVWGGGAPVFLAENEEEQQKLGFTFSRMLDAMAHDLENGVLVIVRH